MASTRIVVASHDEKSYDVKIGNNVVMTLGLELRKITQATKVFIVTDSNVAPLYLLQVKQALANYGFKTKSATIPAGESSKTLEVAGEIYDAMACANMSRDCIVLALGGGVVGDIAGFIAATYMRGVQLVQVPTSLLAMVDSSVGGKTAVNIAAGKNLVGAFWQPIFVCVNLEYLQTLPEKELACGFAEIAKMALLSGDDDYFWLVENAHALLEGTQPDAQGGFNTQMVYQAIIKSVVFKAKIVAGDPLETLGLRNCLNYGHTYGHVVETLAGFGTYTHGQAVAEGIRFASALAESLTNVNPEFTFAQFDLLDSLGLHELDFKPDVESAMEVFFRDKKVSKDQCNFIILEDVGKWKSVRVSAEKLKRHLEMWISLKA